MKLEVINNMENKKGGDLICKRPETIIEARFSLTKRQNDVLDMVFSIIGNDNKLRYEIDVAKYSILYNIKDKSNIYRDIKKAVKTFEGKGFSLTTKNENKKEHRIYFAWFSSIEYIEGEGKIVLELGQRLKEILLNAKKASFYQLKYSLNFHNIYSKRMYYYLKSFENSNGNGTGWRIDNLDELRTKLECPKSYDMYYEFKRLVLNPACEEINGSSDISFEYEEIKTKSKVTSLRFNIKVNLPIKSNSKTIENEPTITTTESKEEPHYDIKLIKKVQAICYNHKLKNNEAICLLKDANNDINLIKKYYEYTLKQTNVPNVVGYIRNLIKDFSEPQSSFKTSGFNDVPQRTYDYDDLEKKLLGWDDVEKSETEEKYQQSHIN